MVEVGGVGPQWGHHVLEVGNKRWANKRNAKELLDFVEVFEVSQADTLR